MTRAEQIDAARSALEFAQAFRAGVAELMVGPAKPAILAQADAVIANGKMVLARLEHASAPLSSSLPQPAGVQ